MTGPALLELPHHDGSALYLSDDSPALGDRVTVRIRVPHGDGARRVWVRSLVDAEPFITEGVVDRTTETETWWRAELDVTNPTTSYRFLLDGGPRGYRWLNGTGAHPRDVTDASDFRLSAAAPPPAWAREAYVYQIFPDRFARSDRAGDRAMPSWAEPTGWDDPVEPRGRSTPYQIYGGDLDGITERLDHLATLGVNTIYLTPFFPAESNHRYNASSFHEVDPLLGGDRALARLSDAVHARGWRLIGDLTTNHSGDTHPWFQRAVREPDSPERDFYYFSGPDSQTYDGWLGHASLPKFRHTSTALRDRLTRGPTSVAASWLRPPYALDGWRVDVANMTGRRGADDLNADVARELRETMSAIDPAALLLAEHCHDASADLAGDGWHGAMNYAGFTRPVWTWLRARDLDEASFLGLPVPVPRLGAEALMAVVRDFIAAAPWRSTTTSWSLLGSHDTARIRTVVGSAEMVEVAAGVLFTMPGTPMVFAGDEIGLEGRLGEDSRRPFPWHRPDRWESRTLAAYSALAALRHAHPSLRRGGLRWVHADGDALVFLRESREERSLVLARRAGGTPVRLPAALLDVPGEGLNLYGGAASLRPDHDDMITLPGDGPTFQIWQLAAPLTPEDSHG